MHARWHLGNRLRATGSRDLPSDFPSAPRAGVGMMLAARGNTMRRRHDLGWPGPPRQTWLSPDRKPFDFPAPQKNSARAGPPGIAGISD